MPKEYFKEKGKNKSGGGPFAMGSYGSGKNPILMLGDLDKDDKMSGYESKRQAAIEKNTKPGPPMKYGSPVDMYDKKGSMAQKKKKLKNMPDAQRKAVFASGYKG